MTEMVELVARALWEAYRDSIPANAEIPSWNDGMMMEHQRNSYRAYARTAIAAMREPTDAQYEALSATGKVWRDLDSKTVWQTYIDAALGVKPSGD